MRVTTLLRRLLGCCRQRVLSVRFEGEDVIVEAAVRGRSRCPGCRQKRPRYDRAETRRWRDLDAFGRRAFIEATPWRVDCPTCGVLVEEVSWAAPRSRFTLRFEELVAWQAQRCDKTTIERQMRIAWRTVGAIIERVVQRRREPIDWKRLHAISVDELSYRKGHHYLTLVTNLETGRIIWSKEGRSEATLTAFFDEIGPEACAAIRHAAIDMSAGYEAAIRKRLPNATIVFDRFHVQQLASLAVDQVRREQWRELQGTAEARAIKHTRWALLKRPWNVTPRQNETLATLSKTNARLYRSYLLKESLAGIYDRRLLPGWACRRLTEWLAWASRSKLAPFVRLAGTIRRHFAGVLAYFHTGFTTSASEGQNTKARLATRQAFGFHSADAVRAIIELRCSGLVIPLPYPS